MEDLTGKQLGPYQVIAPLGEGGMAAVYRAFQPSMERFVALKILPRTLASDPQFIVRFRQEAKVLAQLQHPHILPVFDFGEADGYTYLVMPYIKSGTLTDELKGQPLPLDRIRTVVTQVGRALDYAHAHGLIHRDIKPSNVLIDESGNCLLSDFGLAKILEGSEKLTTTGAIMGTPAYMSPEQGLGRQLDQRSDVYALGIILYEMAVGRTPFTADTPMAVVVKHISDPLPPPSKINRTVPEPIERVILKALAKIPDDRYQTAKAMVEALERAVAEVAASQPTKKVVKAEAALPTADAVPSLPVLKSPADMPTLKPERRRRPFSPALVAAIAALVLVVGGIGGVALFAALSGGMLFAQPTATTNKPTQVSSPAPTETQETNVALQKSVYASRSIQGPAAWVVDGDPDTAWGAGDFPPQWIEIDLGARYTIIQIRLWVTQDPAGETEHVVTGRGPDRGYLYTFTGITRSGDTLNFTPPQPWPNVQFIKVETTKSPSWVGWREIEVYTAQP